MKIAGESVSMLAETVQVHDIEDAEGFVAATIERSGIRTTQEEFEELLAEGITILIQLSKTFEPQRPGHDTPGRFSGYAAMFLPRKLGDAWHKLHPEHHYVTDPETGKRRWVFFEKPQSLDSLVEREDPVGGKGKPIEATFRSTNEWAAPTPIVIGV